MTRVRVKSVVHNPVEKADGSPLPFLGLEDLESGTGRLLVDELPLKAAEDSVKHQVGDVLFSKLRPYLAKSYLPKEPGTATGELLVLRPSSKINPRYLFYVTLSQPWIEWANATAYGTKMPRTSWDLLGEYRMWLPPLEEQRRIADFLDAETARIDHLCQLQESVKRKLDERDRAMRDTLVDELARTVGEVPFRRFITRIEQGVSPQCEAAPRAGTDEWAVLKLSAVKGGHFDPTENKKLPGGSQPISAYEVQSGDLLVTRANTPNLVGDVAVATGDVRRLLLPDLIYRVKLAANIQAEYVVQVALSSRLRLQIESAARGSSQSMVKLRGEDIKEWLIPSASSAQQAHLVREVARGTEATGRLRNAIDHQLELLAERRQALITAAVTGQIDVSTASGRGIEDGLR